MEITGYPELPSYNSLGFHIEYAEDKHYFVFNETTFP